MRISYNWLKEFVDISASPEEVANRLTMIGLEVEDTESISDDAIFDVNITPNRPDCLSIIGIARELSAIYKLPLSTPSDQIRKGPPLSDFSVKILTPELCHRYAGRIIENVTISHTPDWMQKRLEKCGIRSINNVVDITNYILLQYGHPLHAFDADMIKGREIRVASAGFQESIVTLDGIERKLPEEALLIWDSEKPIAIAGIMGGVETEVTNRTKNIFLESAYFNPSSIRKTSKRLGLVSESSYRFERGTDIILLENALNLAALMIKEIAGGTIYEIIDEYPVKYASEPIDINYERINRFLGITLRKEEILETLTWLGLSADKKGQSLLVYPPSFRTDLKRESDIAEEIARIYGYDMIPKKIPKSPPPSGVIKKKLMYRNRIYESMRQSGFTEAINYSFMNPLSLETFLIPETDRRQKTISIQNPLRQEESRLRTTLIPSLIENCKYNLDRGINDIRLFEIASVFEDIGQQLPIEEIRLGGILYKEDTPSLWRNNIQGFFIVKGVIESLFEEVKISTYKFLPSPEPFLHKGKATDIYISDLRVGYLGVIAPQVLETFDLKKKKPEIVLFELALDHVLSNIPKSLKYRSIPKYPFIERDIAIVIDDTIASSAVSEIIRSFPSEMIEDVSIFDVYKGDNIPNGKKSLAFNIIYRSKEKTLTDKEVEEAHAALVHFIIEKTGGTLRT